MPTVIPSDGFRYYGKFYNTNHGVPAFQYIYDSGVVWQNDAGMLITGAARPVVPGDLASTSNLSISGGINVGSVAVTGGNITINSGSYAPSISVITGSQVQIPVGTKSASVAIISGYAYINGNGPLFAGLTLGFGGYDGRFPLSSTINVGTTGDAASPSQVVVLWET